MSGATPFLDALGADAPFVAAELRPPRAELAASASRDAWIDTYHAVRTLTRRGAFVCLTDSAVGLQEEDNLRHLVSNLGADVPRHRIAPFLTSKHSLEYCLGYADRAQQHGFPTLVVLGGDRHVGPPRCVEHATDLRTLIRRQAPALTLGGWANPNADPSRQVDYVLDKAFAADFFLTQIVSHHSIGGVERFVNEGRRRGVQTPGVFGVFFYRSANPRTLETLQSFLPVPAEALTREFGAGASAEDVCAATVRALLSIGVQRFYISNLPLSSAPYTLDAVLEKAGLGAFRT